MTGAITTWVIVPEPGSSQIVGYYTVSPDPTHYLTSLEDLDDDERASLSDESAKMFELKWFGVALRWANKGGGSFLLRRVIRELGVLSLLYPVQGLLLLPIDDVARRWYLKLDYGFVAAPNGLELFLPIQTIHATIMQSSQSES